jgi:transcriptional regulator with GAF, ATPase, and Fis domain
MSGERSNHVMSHPYTPEPKKQSQGNGRPQGIPFKEVAREDRLSGLVGDSPKIRELAGFVRAIAATDVTVLVQGETGTGKELIAKAIHHHSPRRERRFVAINCGSLAETLLESELFGHEKGAFTGAAGQRKGIFEVADGGTLFLDEIGEIPPSTQVKLLRVLQEGEFQRVGGTEVITVDVRIVAATNQNLEDLTKQGRFRQDLYYRLHVIPVCIPPLREHAEDIPPLTAHFLDKFCRKTHKAICTVTPQAMALLMAYPWPGNVRELENVIQRMVVMAKGERLDLSDIPGEIRGREASTCQAIMDLKDIARASAGIAEKCVILNALAQTGGNITQAARCLGVSRATLHTKIKLYGVRSSAP